jgi:hypothetical protein
MKLNCAANSTAHAAGNDSAPNSRQIQPRGWAIPVRSGVAQAPVRHLSPEELEHEYLEQRALTVADARRAGVSLATCAATLNRGYEKQPCLLIPYHDWRTGAVRTYSANGEILDYARVRLLGDSPAQGFVRKKPVRYRQPKGSPVFAYFATGTGIDWQAVLDDPEIPIVLTEGEFKGLCACVHGMPTIALGGIDNFKNGGAFLPELEPFVASGRKVIICPDSDFSDKPAVQAAVRRLASELTKHGAAVHIACLPGGDGGKKLGLDDAIQELGAGPVIELLSQAPPVTDFETIIDVAPARLLENLDQLDEAFAGSDLLLYQRSGRLVHVAEAGAATDEDDVRRAAQASVVREVTLPACQQLAMAVVKFTKWNERKKGPVACECPLALAEHYINRVGGWRLCELKGIVQAPTLRDDGTILQSPGFDTQSGILYLPNDEFPPIPDTPTKADALAALDELRYVVRGFEFASPEAEAVWIAAVLTAIVRRILRTAPMFAFSAPVMGAGKTLAADLLSIIATGHEPAVMSQGGSPEEDRKRLLSVLLRGDSVTQIDNCELPIEGDALCAILTSPEWQERILGRTEMSRVPTNTTFLATGNNLTFRGDMSTRAVMCKLLPKAERPEERQYGWDARAETRAARPRLVAAALTIIRAYVVAGRPGMDRKPFGRFEHWQAMIQDPLLWLGAPDPCKTRELVERNDPDREVFGRLILLWSKVFGQRPIRVKEVGELTIIRTGDPPEKRELYDLACELSGDKGREIFNPVAFGKFLRSKEERLSGGLRLVQGTDKKNKVSTWALVSA